MTKVLLLLFMFSLYSACHYTKFTQENQSETKPDFEVFTYKIPKDKYTNYLVYIKSNAEDKTQQIPFPEELWAECQGKRVDFAPTKINTIYEYSVYVPAWFYTIETILNLGNCRKLRFIANRQQIEFFAEFAEPMEMFQAFPQILNIGDTIIVFVLDLLRLKPPEDEYFPTSERLRVEITNKLGKLVWNSDYDLNFLQIIGKVEPVEVGEIQRYIIPWNRMDNDGKFVAEGEFNVSFILPMKPKKLTRTMKLELNKM
ncbi:MAG: hypothetical protein ACK42Z_01880 [Candidatus Kapaibacteriota bacterium]